MRLLRLVGQGDDGTSLILESTGTAEPEQFSLPIDDRLRNAASSDLPRLSITESVAAIAPTPREIQTRVRGGESAQSVADRAGISLERVMRFAYPVLQERVRVTDEARRARARRGPDGHLVEFGDLIESRFAEHAVDPGTVAWDAHRRDDGGWTVSATVTAHEQSVLATFSFVLTNRTVSALNDTAADLLSDRPVRSLLPPAPPEYDPATFDDDLPAVPARLAAVPDHAPEEVADPSGSVHTTPAVRAPSQRQKAHTRPIPVGIDDELFDQDASPQQWDEPPLPLELGEDATDPEPPPAPAPAEEPEAKRGRRGDKPRMPSWDDILLGVRNKTD